MKSPLAAIWEQVPEMERQLIEEMYRRHLGSAGVLFNPAKEDWARDCLLAWLASVALVEREAITEMLRKGGAR